MGESAFSWLLIVEIVLPFVILSIVLLVALSRGKNRFKKAMRQLIINVKEREAVQLESIQRFLHEKLGYSEDAVDATSKAILKERKFFFRTFVSSVLNKDIDNLASLDEELSRITEKYHSLTVGGAVSAPAEEAATEPDAGLQSELEAKQAEIEKLNEDVKDLRKEVHVTLTTLNSIFAEYSSMFGEEVEQKNLSVEQILTAMESFAGPKGAGTTEAKSAPAEAASEVVDPDDILNEAAASEADELELDEPQSDAAAALDELELESSEEGAEGEEEPDWGDAFAESGDEMTKDPD